LLLIHADERRFGTKMSGEEQHRILDIEIVNAFLAAAKDLGVRVTAPFTLSTPSGEETFEALIHDFGGPKGTVTGRVALRDARNSRTECGYYASNLSDSYRRYDRSLFIATLDDWKWYGSQGQKPFWYTGRNWS
jgi:hypothetical protein